jgi:cytoskeletal protein CcmA (bactofilin family)/DNA-directed RNA polymerase subunit RPC12/RpoP
MPVKKQLDLVLVACPHCGHQQPEPPSAFSTLCKECRRHFRVQEILNPAAVERPRGPRLRRIACFECGAELEVPVSAESTMCKWCSRYVDLNDHRIPSAIAKNYKTKGKLVIEPKGCVFNTESIAGEVILKGKFHGKLTAEQSLTIFSGAEIKGNVTTAHLIIPAENHFSWQQPIQTGSAEIAGELVGALHASGTVILKSTARYFGDLESPHLVVEEGAVVVGSLTIGSLKPLAKHR